MTTTPIPRYDRIISLALIVILGLAVVLLIDSNPNILRARLGGDLPTVTVSWLLMSVLVVIASAGADLMARGHPQMQNRDLPTLRLGSAQIEITPGFWILPSFSVIGSFAFFRLFSASLPGLAFALVLIAAGTLLFAVLVAQHYALDRDPVISQRARLILQIIAYILAFCCFSAIYFVHFRTLYAAALIGATGSLLSYAVLRWSGHRQLIYLALLIGLVLGEAIWAFNYWPLSFLPGGTALLILFYVATGIVQQYLSGTLQRRFLIEYGVIGTSLLAVVMYTAFAW